jgi:hypothetical protein
MSSSIKKHLWSWVLVAHTYNPSYSGGRDQEDNGLKPAQAKSWKKSQKRDSRLAQALRAPA